MFSCTIVKFVRGYEEHKVQHGEKKFKCFECGEGFGTKRALSQHIRELCSPEAKGKEYNCDHCPAGPFKVKRYLKTHLKKCLDNPNRLPAMQCTICGGKKLVFHR